MLHKNSTENILRKYFLLIPISQELRRHGKREGEGEKGRKRVTKTR